MRKTKNENREPLILQSAGPIDDCGRKWNLVYVICGGAGAILGILLAGFSALCVLALIGLFVGWVIKSNICKFKAQSFRLLRFSVTRQMPYPELTTELIRVLTPLGMSIENLQDGSINISYKGLIYDVSYESETTFMVWWRTNLARAMFKMDEIGAYRKISQATGIIAWNVQQICNTENGTENLTDAMEGNDV